MNYLAHALLSPDEPRKMMGNLWGDLLKPMDYPQLSASVLEGVAWHKEIDRYTDQHPAVDEMVKLIRPFQGKYTPVVADVLMDYMLSKHWHLFSDQPLEAFCDNIYQQVNKLILYIPDRLHPRIQRMMSHRWLESCKNTERLSEALKMLSRRASFDNQIAEALTPYEIHQEAMDEHFLSFFTEIKMHLSLRSEN